MKHLPLLLRESLTATPNSLDADRRTTTLQSRIGNAIHLQSVGDSVQVAVCSTLLARGNQGPLIARESWPGKNSPTSTFSSAPHASRSEKTTQSKTGNKAVCKLLQTAGRRREGQKEQNPRFDFGSSPQNNTRGFGYELGGDVLFSRPALSRPMLAIWFAVAWPAETANVTGTCYPAARGTMSAVDTRMARGGRMCQ
jgi:hypothetical protein